MNRTTLSCVFLWSSEHKLGFSAQMSRDLRPVHEANNILQGPYCPPMFSTYFLTEQGMIAAPLAFHWLSDHGFLLSLLWARAYPCHTCHTCLTCRPELWVAFASSWRKKKVHALANEYCWASIPTWKLFWIKKPKPNRFNDNCNTLLCRKDKFCA